MVGCSQNQSHSSFLHMVENVFHTNTDVDLTNELMNANQKLEYKTFEPADYKSISY